MLRSPVAGYSQSHDIYVFVALECFDVNVLMRHILAVCRTFLSFLCCVHGIIIFFKLHI